MSAHGHKHTGSVTQNHKAQLANAYNELGKELSSNKMRVIGNYTLGKVIGEGAYGKVRLGIHRLTSTRVAIKQIPKTMSAALTREIHHHRQLHHPHVTQMYEVIATESSIWIVTELCSGGELFDYLAEKGRLEEDEARILFGQLCLAVYYLHEKGIVHRDLKLENVLLDERCRVKLGDFGFTREYERGTYMETFCGTTGYASPEMLQGKKYMGPEVDVWSLGIILYCLLTGTLPFDDDDDAIMRDMIIRGDFDDPEWLSTDARELIKSILVGDPINRLTIPQILAHPWFTARVNNGSVASLSSANRPLSPPPTIATPSFFMSHSIDPCQPASAASSLTSDSTFLSASSEFATSAPTTPDDHSSHNPFDAVKADDDQPMIHRNSSESTIQRALARPNQSSKPPETVIEEESLTEGSAPVRPPFHSYNSTSSSVKGPAYPARTPVRTKRRSVSSTLSDPASPTADKPFTPMPPQDFATLLNTPAPMIFSTPLERELLNSMSLLGLDTAQIVHSVLSDACDAAGAVWWMLKRKSEKKIFESDHGKLAASATVDLGESDTEKARERQRETPSKRGTKRGVSVQTDIEAATPLLSLARSAPELAFVPPTPTAPSTARSTTPPRTVSPMGRLSPSMSPSPSGAESFTKSHSSTPLGRDGLKGRRDGKGRSGSVSIMQRATTALEAAGLVRKKSTEGVRDQHDKEREREKSREFEKKVASGEEPRSSYGSGSSKLTKSPPMRAQRDTVVPSTPTSDDSLHPQPLIGSPWVVTGSKPSSPQSYAPTPANSPGDTLTSLPNFSDTSKIPSRSRASLLSAFRFWFNEDRKGKRKDPPPHSSSGTSRGIPYRNSFATSSSNMTPANKNTVKRRTSGSGSKFQNGSHRGKRHSVSSRRSSSVNSRRSSGTSGLVMESPHLVLEQVPTRRSFGAHTPNSERGEYSSRPSSLHSLSLNRHRKSPSASSAGSAHFRAASPIQKYHRRAGSGSSTRVVRQIQPTRPSHIRSNSATSSIHSFASSRPTSCYEPSESEGQRTGSPSKRQQEDINPRRMTYGSTTFVAQKKQTPFTSPGHHANLNSIGRSSWKRSWGLEPPGWQSRAIHLPIEVLAISPATDSAGGIRDVFSGRASLSLGDEDDWVDEDEDIPTFAAGLGQMSTLTSSTFGQHAVEPMLTLSHPPRALSNRLSTKRTNRNTGLGTSGPCSTGRQKPGLSPVGRTSPVQPESPYEPPDSRTGRRQLPAGRSGPAFRGHAIVEEDEGEEE